MKKQILLITGLIGVFAMTGCVMQPVQTSQTSLPIEANKVIHQEVVPKEAVAAMPTARNISSQASHSSNQLIKISGIGYGATSTYEGFTIGQKRLMAIRASKLDAYRSLAEQLFGIRIDSNTSVSTLMARSDNFRARINAVVRGARVVSITPMADGNYETVLEVFIDQSFFKNAFVYSACPSGNCQSKPIDLSQICSSGLDCRNLSD